MALDQPLSTSSGPISWMARHHVAANLVMVIFILGGLLVSTSVKQEVFPEFEIDVIRVSVAYPGASPEEVEQGIILSIEDAVRGLDGVDEVRSTASEGSASIQIELTSDANTNSVLQDVNNEIEGIQSFPELAESPIISLIEVRHQVLTIMVHGNQEDSENGGGSSIGQGKNRKNFKEQRAARAEANQHGIVCHPLRQSQGSLMIDSFVEVVVIHLTVCFENLDGQVIALPGPEPLGS